MRLGSRWFRAAAGLCAVALVAACGSPAASQGGNASDTGTVSGTLVVNGAGTLARPFKAMIAAFERHHPEVTVQSRFAGSVEVVRRVTELGTPVDVVGVADYSLIPSEMFDTGYADWYVGFVANRITFAYTDRSTGAAGLTEDNWYDVLARPGVRIGRSNPDTDPSGYQVLQMLDLAGRFYDKPDLRDGVLANSPPETMVGTETQLLPAVSSGQIDYLGIYRSDALQHDLRFIDLPSDVDLSDPAKAGAYGQVKLPTASGVRTGRPIVYALTVSKKAPNAAAGLRFVEFVLSAEGQKIMRDNGFTVVDPAVSGGRSLPPSIERVSEPNELPGG